MTMQCQISTLLSLHRSLDGGWCGSTPKAVSKQGVATFPFGVAWLDRCHEIQRIGNTTHLPCQELLVLMNIIDNWKGTHHSSLIPGLGEVDQCQASHFLEVFAGAKPIPNNSKIIDVCEI